MGPFELMNVTGIPIALHAATTLGEAFGPMYAPAETARRPGRVGRALGSLRERPTLRAPPPLTSGSSRSPSSSQRSLVDEEVGTIEDTDIGARVGLRWPRGPFEMMNKMGIKPAGDLVGQYGGHWGVAVPGNLSLQWRRAFPSTSPT
jgi:enoyl-CoA hydratase/3-hydroxyacyl-CoA dehydrogenase